MKLEEARQEAQRYLDYLARDESKVIALQKLAADRRAGRCGDEECRRRRAEIQGNGVTVYDGGNLAEAIKVFLKVTE